MRAIDGEVYVTVDEYGYGEGASVDVHEGDHQVNFLYDHAVYFLGDVKNGRLGTN